MPKYDAVLFDLDGTLLNTLDDLTDAVNHTMRAFDCPTHSRDDVRRFVGNGIRRLIERALPNGASDPRMEDALAAFTAYYTAHCNVKTAPYPGILDALNALHEAGVKLAIVSNKNDEAVKALAELYFGGLAEAAVGASDVVPRKPAPEMPRKALNELGADAEHALYVGDSDVDFDTARNADMDCMLVSWGFRDRELLESLHPTMLIDDAAEMPMAILCPDEEDDDR